MELISLLNHDQIKTMKALAGNSKSFEYPCTTIPKAVDSLAKAPSYSGHDLWLGLCPVLIHAEISKPFRCLLLFFYGKYLNPSSQSLMHKDLAGIPLNEIDSTFKYGFSFTTNVRLLKRMSSDLKTIQLIPSFKKWPEIKDSIKTIDSFLHDFIEEDFTPEPTDINSLSSFFCSIKNKEENLIKSYRKHHNSVELFFINFNLSWMEQMLRYSSGTLFTSIDLSAKDVKLTDNKFSMIGIFTQPQIRTIIDQRKNHKLPEWKIVTEYLKKINKTEKNT